MKIKNDVQLDGNSFGFGLLSGVLLIMGIACIMTTLFPPVQAYEQYETNLSEVFINPPPVFQNQTTLYINGSLNGSPFEGQLTGQIMTTSFPVGWDIIFSLVILMSILNSIGTIAIIVLLMYFLIFRRGK